VRTSGRLTSRVLLALAAAIGGCATTAGPEELALLRIARREGPGDRWSTDRDRALPPADLGLDRLAQALRDCTRREPSKFVPRYRVTLVGRSGRETLFLVSGRRVKVHGISYACGEDVEAITERRWGSGVGP
jgi:hypothetical protein